MPSSFSDKRSGKNMKTKTVTLLHPGNMGATIGASVTGARVL